MSIQLISTENGLVTLQVSGTITPDEQAQFQKRVVEIIPAGGKSNVLVLAQEFQGWGKGDWGNMSAQAEYDRHVERMAIVGDEKWKDLAVLFTGKGFRSVQIEMFGDLNEARAWLGAQS